MRNVNYREQGVGPAVIFIHGFPLNLQMWNDLVKQLSPTLRVVTLDLPGFGESTPLPDGFGLEDVARTILSFMKENGFERPVVVGHSLGGYIALAMAEIDPGSMAGICLFHSTAMDDSPEKKESRNKVLEFIEKQGVQAFTSNFIGQLYADPQHTSITRVKTLAIQSTKETVIAYTKAMRDRKNRTGIIKTFSRPILFLAGAKDQGIPPDSIKEQALMNKEAEAIILPDVAHMGMFEAETECLKNIQKFISKSQVTF